VKSSWRAELYKIATVRGQWIGAVLATSAIPLTSLLVVATGGLGPRATATSAAATGSVAGLVAFGAWGATIAASEYATQTIMVSLATVPRRGVLYGAKLVSTATAAGTCALLSTTLAFLIVLAVRPPGHHPLGDPAALVIVPLAVVAVAVVGAALGLITRSVGAANAIVIAAVLLPNAAGSLLGGLEPWIVGASPGTVITQIVGGSSLPATQMFPLGEWASAVAMLVVASAVALTGAFAFIRRDG
jgi:ABC-2 type transport system permease protein